MSGRVLARDALWEVAVGQHGFVTAQQAAELAVSKSAVQMLVHRGSLVRAAHGVYRFGNFPVGQYDDYMLAVLWTRVPEAVLSHETALDAFGISDVNPHVIHVTVGAKRRLRRADSENYVVHYEDLGTGQVGWWQEIPIVTAVTAIEQCMATGTPTYLLRQAIERGHASGYVMTVERDRLADLLEVHRG